MLFCATGTRKLLHKRWREGGRKGGRDKGGGGWVEEEEEEEEERVPLGISQPAAPSGTRHERHS